MAKTPSAAPDPGEAEQLLEAHLSGDASAFGQLVELYEGRLYGFLERFTGDSHLAEDVFQQVFMKVFAKGAGFDHRSSFSTWLFRIARNAATDELRRRRGPNTGEFPELAAPGRQPLERLAGEETLARIMAAVDALPEAQREAFLLKEEAGLGFQEIADIADCSKDTAKSRFRLAVEKLRAVLSAEGLGPGGASHA